MKKVKVSHSRYERWGGPELIPGLSHQPAVGMRRARTTVRWPFYLSVPRLPSQLCRIAATHLQLKIGRASCRERVYEWERSVPAENQIMIDSRSVYRRHIIPN